MSLYVLSAGAAKGLVDGLQPAFLAETKSGIDGIFNAVGAIRDRFISGVPCDVVILTAAQIAGLDRDGLLIAGSAAAIGAVPTAVAVPAGHSSPVITDSVQLRTSLLAASALYVPDTKASTAGRHVQSVLDQLGIADEMASRLRMFPNGETAMRTLAADATPRALGCTQITEIRNTPGLTPVGNLPPPHDLATTYTAAVSARAVDAASAAKFVALLTGPGSSALREQCGFEAG